MKTKSILCSVIVVLLTFSSFLLLIPQGGTSYAEGSGTSATAEPLPSAYCMRDEYIVYAQNQDSHGYCWNFAATMAASTTIMKATGEYYDFSELWTGVSLVTSSSQYKQIGAGGSLTYQHEAMKQSGLMLEADLPYQYSYTVSNENAADYYNFFEKYSNDDLARCLAYDSDTRFSRSEVDEIKRHIYEHGSVYMSFMFRTGFIESDGAYYLEPNQKNTTSNHAVSVIGWDDDYQKEFYLDGSDTPTVFKGAWIILNSYTEKSGNDGISFVFYEDNNIGTVSGYRYEPDTAGDLYFYDKIESGYAYPTSVKGKYYGDFTAKTGATKQKNIFYDDVALTYSYTASPGASVERIDIYRGDQNVTAEFSVSIDSREKRFYISGDNAAYGQYKVIVTYGNGERTDTYLNNFFVTHGLVGEEIEYDYANNTFPFNPGRDLEFYSFASRKNYVIYTNALSGSIAFLPTEQSVYSEKSMSIPNIPYQITNGKSSTSTHRITSDSGYQLDYNFTFEYCTDTSLQPVNVYYDLGGGVNHSENRPQELAGPTSDLVLYEPTRPGYTFKGWYLDYGNGSEMVPKNGDVSCVSWEDIHHMGESPNMRASSYYKQYYNNSNTLFVYAHWEEEEYYRVELSITGEGTSQIGGNILVSSDDSVRYLLIPESGWCLSEVRINGTPVSSDELVQITEYGLLLEDIDSDISISVTFSQGVYLSLTYGENVKTAYVIGTYNGETKKFYNGDYIPTEYFTSTVYRPGQIRIGGEGAFIVRDRELSTLRPTLPVEPTLRPDLPVEPTLRPVLPVEPSLPSILPVDPTLRPVLPVEPSLPSILPVEPSLFSGSRFVLVVELCDDRPGYTYEIDNLSSYSCAEAGVFQKYISFGSNVGLKEIDVGSATEKPVEQVKISYAVGSYVLDHYLSADINATSGDKGSATYEAGQIVYLFIKTHADTAVYHYRLPAFSEPVGSPLDDGQWYRKAIYVSAGAQDLGTATVYREKQSYTVTWKNWDGSVIYSEKYRYGDLPAYKDRNSDPVNVPVRPDDDEYSYLFVGWDREIGRVSADVTYTATYATMRRYVVTVEPTENGTVTPDGENYINRLDRHTYVFTPDPGYRVKDVIVNGESVGACLYYTFVKIQSDQTLRVEFERVKHAVKVICGENGSTDRTGEFQVDHGDNATICITPAELYLIDFIKVNGEPVSVTDRLTLEGITGDTVVEIAFRRGSFRIETASSSKGSVTPSQTVAAGTSVRIDFDAKLGCRVKDVTVDGVSVGAVSHYTLVGVLADHTVTVEYEVNAWAVAASAAMLIALGGLAVAVAQTIRLRRRGLCDGRSLGRQDPAGHAGEEETTDQESK